MAALNLARPRPRDLLVAILVAIGVAVLVMAGRALTEAADGMAPLWIANAAVLASLARYRRLDRRTALAATALGLMAGNLASGSEVAAAAMLAVANLAEILVGLWLLARFANARQTLCAPRNLAIFFLCAGFIAPALSALIGPGYLAIATGAAFAPLALHWYAADALGMLVVGPLVLALEWRALVALWRSRQRAELLLIQAGVALATYLVFYQYRYPSMYLLFPVLTLVVFRLRLIGAALALAIVAAIGSIETIAGIGPIAHAVDDAGERALLLEVVLSVIVISTFPVAAVLAERDRMMDRLVQGERRFRRMAEAAPIAMFRTDADGRIIYSNEHWFDLVGGRTHGSWLNLLADETRSYVEPLWHASGRAGVPFTRDVEIVGASGRRGWVALAMSPELDPDGDGLSWIGAAADVDERRRAQAKLEESNRVLQLAEKIAGLGHWRLDLATRTLFWSDEVYHIHGREIGNLPGPGQAVMDYVEEDRPRILDVLSRAQSAGAPWSHTARVRRPNGELRHVESIGTVERAPDGSIIALIGIFRDITDRIEAEAALVAARDEARQSAEAKSTFLATMSHEIRTPMTGVLGMIELLRADDLSRTERERYFENLEQSGTLLMAVLDDVLDFSKIESQNLELERLDFDIAELARNTLDLFRHAASKKGLKLALSLPVGGATVAVGDPVRLQQVISNLISNAIKFTPEGKVELKVDIRTQGGRPVVSCEVIDTGIGIPADKLGQLFEPFVQADVSTTRHFGGTGLGLAIARRLVEAMDGTIGVASTEGAGARFHFEVTLDPSANGVTKPVSQHAPQGRALSILLAEDNPINRSLVEALVQRLGHHIHSVENGVRAVAAAQGRAFDVILMDMQMPEMDGLAATRAIRAGNGPCAQVPIIALTADASAERRRFYDNAGLSDFMTKPIDSDLLRQRLGTIAANDVPQPAVPAVLQEEAILLDEPRLARLEEMIGSAGFARIVAMFETELKTRPHNILAMIESGSHAAVEAEAHALKGASMNVGATRVAELARDIEMAVRDRGAIGTLGHDLVAAADATLVALDDRNRQRKSA